MSRLLAWIKKESEGEKLIATALVEFAEGRATEALGNLIQGVLELAAGTKGEAAIFNIQTRMANFNLIPPVASPMAGAQPQTAAATTAPTSQAAK